MGASRSAYRKDEEGEDTWKGALSLFGHGVHILFKLFFVAVITLILVYGIRMADRLGYSVFTSGTAQPAPGTDKQITITAEMSDKQIAELLEENGLVNSSLIFRIQDLIYGYELLPGTYTLNSSQTIAEMLKLLSTETEDGS